MVYILRSPDVGNAGNAWRILMMIKRGRTRFCFMCLLDTSSELSYIFFSRSLIRRKFSFLYFFLPRESHMQEYSTSKYMDVHMCSCSLLPQSCIMCTNKVCFRLFFFSLSCGKMGKSVRELFSFIFITNIPLTVHITFAVGQDPYLI